MAAQLYGLIIAFVAAAFLPVVGRQRRRLFAVSPFGWGKLQLGLSFFIASGILFATRDSDFLMRLFVPAVTGWLNAIGALGIAAGLCLLIWGVSNIASFIRHVEDQKGDDAEWRSLYLQLQDLSQQPFSFVEILNLALNQLLKRSEADGAAVMLFKENTSELILASFSNLAPATTKRLELLGVTGDIFGRAQKLGRIQTVATLTEADRATVDLFEGSGFISAAVFPLRSRDKVLGSVGLFSAKPFHFSARRTDAIAVGTNHLATLLEAVRSEKEISRLKDRLKPSEEAKRIVEELFFRRGMGANLELREAIEFERVRRFFDADCMKLVLRDSDGEYRIKASSGGAETGLLLDRRKLAGINRAVGERKLLLLTSPTSSPPGNGHDSMPRQTLFIPVPYPDRDDLVLLLESQRPSLNFSEEKLSAVRVASVYLADLHFLFLAKRDGDRFRTSLAQLDDAVSSVTRATSRSQMAAALGEACSTILPGSRGRLVILAAAEDDDDLLVGDAAGFTISSEMDWIRYNRFLKAMDTIFIGSGAGEQRIDKSALAAAFPEDLRDRFDKYFAHLPQVTTQIVIPVEYGDRRFGSLGLYFAEEEPAPHESLSILRSVVRMASLTLAANTNPAPTDPRPDRTSIPLREIDRSEALQDQPDWRGIDSDLDLNQMPSGERSELTTVVESLVMRMFQSYPREKLYLSSHSDTRFRYYQVTLSSVDSERFRAGELDAGDWLSCSTALDYPQAFRMLPGDYLSKAENGRISSLTWRLPADHDYQRRTISVLGIDDQEVIRDLLQNIISQMGHRIVTVNNGQEAIRLFRQEHFDIVILESGLPGIDGWNIATQVKSLSATTPVIMLAGWGPLSERRTAERRDADFVLTKPFKMDQLAEVIAAACRMIAS